MSDENATPENTEALEPKHALREPEPATDPAEDYKADTEPEPAHDDVDVALQDGKDTADGKGDDEVPPADFQSYADSSADEQQEQS